MNQREVLKDFFAKHLLGTISTVTPSGEPESATVAFSETENLAIIFGTLANTRKFKNLQQNQKVAFVVASGKESVQFEGEARLLEGEELERARNMHLEKNPPSKKYAFDPLQRFFEIAPRWVRYTNLETTPQEVFEIAF